MLLDNVRSSPDLWMKHAIRGDRAFYLICTPVSPL
ncbi:hypothetical protein K788_00035340 (plasmid) [Paraburkholderia caribensis MBA4]|uniref:Uncharacterized protein n=1 Tax=Paraburkholderia caribensis MBA4 TaxID=1323664 RepID=A0A0P0RS26_9BURK|nr:hypothetical protein K788_00035340 [Paraburkholderia caribensis MBA4]